MRWVSPFIHQPGEHGWYKRTEAKWESSPSSVFVPHTLSSRFPSLIGWLWNAQKLVRTTSSLSGCSQIKRSFFFFLWLSLKAMLLQFERGSRDTTLPFHQNCLVKWKHWTWVASLIQTTSCLRQFMSFTSSAVTLHFFSTQNNFHLLL